MTLNPALLIGKTIERIDTRAANVWTIHFTDGSAIILEVESVIPAIGFYGIAGKGPLTADELNRMIGGA